MDHRILITGATGFVGSHLIPYFRAHFSHWKLFALVRGESDGTGLPWGVETISMSRLTESLDTKGITTIVHLAGKAHDTSKNADPNSYFAANYELTKIVFDSFKNSKVQTFVFLSSIKSIHHSSTVVFDETHREKPRTYYGESKLKAEEYIITNTISNDKRYFILRPVLIYGTGVKGNLKTLVTFARKGIPYPFSMYENRRSYLSVNNLSFILAKLIASETMQSDVYNLCDDHPISTKEIIQQISLRLGKKPIMVNVPKFCWNFLAIAGDYLGGPFNSEVLGKITDSMVVNNSKIKSRLGVPLPEDTHDSIANIV